MPPQISRPESMYPKIVQKAFSSFFALTTRRPSRFLGFSLPAAITVVAA